MNFIKDKSIHITKTSDVGLTRLITDLTSNENTKVIILDPFNKLDFELTEKWVTLELTNLVNSNEINDKETALNAFVRDINTSRGIKTEPITEHSIRVGLKIINNNFFEENLYNDKYLYLNNQSDENKHISELILQTILICHNEKLKDEGRNRREKDETITIVFIDFTNVMNELVNKLASEARPTNISLIFACSNFSSFNYIRNSELQHYSQEQTVQD